MEEVSLVEFDDYPFRSQVLKAYRVFITVGRPRAAARKIEFVPGYYVNDVVREIREAVDRAKARARK